MKYQPTYPTRARARRAPRLSRTRPDPRPSLTRSAAATLTECAAVPLACSPHPSIMPASFLHVLPGLVGAWGEIWHGGALELSAFDRLAATARRPGGQKLCRSAIRRSERAGGGPPPARSAQCLQTRRRWGAPLAASLCAASLAVRESSTLHGGLIVETPNLGTTLCGGTFTSLFVSDL